MKKSIIVLTLCLVTGISTAQMADSVKIRKEVGKFAILAGLHQPIVLQGGNFAFNYITKSNISLEASFGIGLDYTNILSDVDQSLYQSVKTPFSYGVGIGYFYRGLSLNFEPKGTMFNIKDYEGKETTYTTWSLGAGLYYNVFLWKGLFLQPSVRYWQKVGSTLSNDQTLMLNQLNQEFIHTGRKPGANGWIYGVSIGWYFKK